MSYGISETPFERGMGMNVSYFQPVREKKRACLYVIKTLYYIMEK